MSKKKSAENFESKLARLEQISELLENNELGLEKSVSLFEEGVALSKECLGILENAELKVKTLKKGLNKTSLSIQDSE
jgi:exodeoxyribonuclease VII small subunit